MAISEKYGNVTIPNIGDDEPVFILRAQDKLAEPTIEMYRALVASHGSSLAEDLQKVIDTFRRWSGLKKIPD
jgi:flavorubredoxin